MREAPRLDPRFAPGPVRRRHALLINPFYPQGPARELRKARAHADARADAASPASTPADWTVGVLGREPPPGAAARRAVSAGRRHHRAPHLRAAGVRARQPGTASAAPRSFSADCTSFRARTTARPHADALAIGEGVQLWGRILRDADAGRLRPRYEGGYREPPYRDDPAPASRHPPARPVPDHDEPDRHARLPQPMRVLLSLDRRAHDALSDARARAGGPGVRGGRPSRTPSFVDNNLGSRPEYLLRLCRELAPLRKIWSAAVSIDVTDRPELVREMALAGCTGVFVGFESLHPDNILDARKKSPRPDDYARRVALLHDHGIQVNGSFVFGFDHDGPDVFERTCDWIESQRLECATFHILTPYPGTPLHAQMKREGPIAPRRLGPVRHRARRVPAEAHDARAAGRWLRVELRTPVLAPVDLATPSARPRRGTPLPRDVVSLQAIEPLLVSLIRFRLTGRVWRPLVAWTRHRHVRFRERLAARASPAAQARPRSVVLSRV